MRVKLYYHLIHLSLSSEEDLDFTRTTKLSMPYLRVSCGNDVAEGYCTRLYLKWLDDLINHALYHVSRWVDECDPFGMGRTGISLKDQSVFMS